MAAIPFVIDLRVALLISSRLFHMILESFNILCTVECLLGVKQWFLIK